MKKYISKLTCLLLALTLCVSLVACNPEKEPENTRTEYTEFVDTYVDTVDKEVVSDSANYFINNGKCDYTIVISKNEYSTKVEEKAAEELNFFINDAYGITLPVVYDTEVNYDTTKLYISIGNTSILDASGMDVSYDLLGNDGYKIQTFDKLVIIGAYGNNGIVYGAYGFLERNLGYHYYSKDEWTITKEKNVRLKNMDVVSRPDFDSRYIDSETCNADNIDWAVRLRHHGRRGSQYAGMEGGAWDGTDQSICKEFLIGKDYHPTHPEWYSAGYVTGDGEMKSGQLCYTTILKNEPHPSDGIRPLDELIKNVIENYIVKKGKENTRVLMFGINDNEKKWCDCSACDEERALIKDSGQLTLFMNAVKMALDNWQQGGFYFPGGTRIPDNLVIKDQETDPNSYKNRKLILSYFAYVYCIEAPVDANGNVIRYDAPYACLSNEQPIQNANTVIENEPDGNDDDIELHGDLNVRIAYLYVENMHTQFDTSYNSVSYKAYEQWSKIAPSLSVWDYGTSFSDYIAPYPDWGTISDNIKYYRMKGVTEILTQLPASTSGTSFYAMMLYVRAQLMWDADQDIEELYKDFMYNYYGPQAYEHMYAYFTFLRNYYQMMDGTYIDEEGNEQTGFINPNGERVVYHGAIYKVFSVGTTFYPYVTTLKLKKFFTDAEASLSLVKNVEPKYQKYLDRVQGESLFVRFLDLKNYSSNYSNEELIEMYNEFKRIAKIVNLTEVTDTGGSRITVDKFVEDGLEELN